MLNSFQKLLHRLIRPVEKLPPAESPALDDIELPEPLVFKEEAEEDALPVMDEVEPVDALPSRALPLEGEPRAVANAPEQSAAADLFPLLSEPRSEPLPTEVPEWERAHLAEAPFGGLAQVEPLFFAHRSSTPTVGAPVNSPDLRDRASKVLSDILAPIAEQPDPTSPGSSLAESVPGSSRTASKRACCELPRLVLEDNASTDGERGFESRLGALLDSFERTTHDREQDQIRTLERLEGLLQKLLDTQPDLSQVSDRLDQLESAHVLRGRL